ncbi:hypothetical protein B9J78_05150 [bacterium Unc6]|nr:hypothetical protein [bacterium Unc6]
MIKKAVILAAGLGTRMQKKDPAVVLDKETESFADEGAKGLIKISQTPFIDYVIDQFLQAGIKEFCFVIRPVEDKIQGHLKNLKKAHPDIKISFAIQKHQKGTADAVLCAEEFAGKDEFILSNYDNVYGVGTLKKLCSTKPKVCYVAAYKKSFLLKNSNIRKERFKGFGIIQYNEHSSLIRIVEKPEDPKKYSTEGSIYLNMNLFKFTPDIFKACRSIGYDLKRNEYELPSAVQYLVDKKFPFYIIKGCDIIVDITERKDIQTAREMLKSVRIEKLKKQGGG